jgi:hypothetical protein
MNTGSIKLSGGGGGNIYILIVITAWFIKEQISKTK